jgi:hypothetical protein
MLRSYSFRYFQGVQVHTITRPGRFTFETQHFSKPMVPRSDSKDVANVLFSFVCPHIAKAHMLTLERSELQVEAVDVRDWAHTAHTMNMPLVILMNEWSDVQSREAHQEVHFQAPRGAELNYPA